LGDDIVMMKRDKCGW